MSPLGYDVAGEGPPVVLLHAGIVDRRVWDRQFSWLAERHRVLRVDLPGFGESAPGPALAPLEALLGELGIEDAVVVGNSLGGRLALELAIAHPRRVGALVLLDAGLPDWEWSAELRVVGAREDELFDAGDLDGATQLSLERWALPEVWEVVRPMQRQAFELQAGAEPPQEERPELDLATISVPTLVIVGERDAADFHAIADHFAAGIAGARKEVVAGAKHLPALERPDAFDALLAGFLQNTLL